MNGIKRTAMWFAMLTKRYLKNPIILVTILAIPLIVLALQFSTGKDEAVVRVALYAKGQDEVSAQAISRLTENESTVIQFYTVDSEAVAYEEVESGKAVCAYIFPEKFSETIEKYVRNEKKDLDFEGHLVKCVQTEKSNYTKITEEMVFATFYQKFAGEVLLEFMKNYKDEFGVKDWELIQEYYDAYDIKAEFFRFEYKDGTENTLMAEQTASFLLLPVRGLILTLILLAGMTGGIVAYRDKEKGMFQSITVNRRGILNYMYVFIPTVIAAVAGMIGIWFAKIWTGFARELICMALYVFLVTGVCNIIRRVCSNGIRFASVIPLYLMFNIVFAPVFLDLSSMLPQISYLRTILPVSYGLSSLYDSGMRMTMFIIGVICLVFVWIGEEKE